MLAYVIRGPANLLGLILLVFVRKLDLEAAYLI